MNLPKKLTNEKILHIIISVVVLFSGVVTLYPFWYIFVASLSDPYQVAKEGGLMIWFKGFDIGAYKAVFAYNSIWVAYKNTLIYLVVGVVVNVTLTVCAAYPLSRKGLKGRNFIMKIIVFTMFFSGGLIPFYLVVNNLGLVDTRGSQIIPYAINVFNFIILRTAFMAIPDTIEEAAVIDGASHFQIMYRIVLPLAKSTIMVIGLYYAVELWNTYYRALLFLRDSNKLPLQILLRKILLQNDTQNMQADMSVASNHLGLTIKYSTIMISTLPIICVYPFIQKYFVKGVMIGSIKG